MLLRGTGTFRPISEVVFVAIAAGIAECEQLERRVRGGILKQDLRFNYHPHLTIAHDLPSANLDEASKSMAEFEAEVEGAKLTLYTYTDPGVRRRTADVHLGRRAPLCEQRKAEAPATR